MDTIKSDNGEWTERYMPTTRKHVDFDRQNGNFVVWDETAGELCTRATFADACAAMDAYSHYLMNGEPESYAAFVASRFKSGPDTVRDLALCTGWQAQFLHATVGMVGEWLEYRTSDSRKNVLEELGDFWFFYTAGAQVLGLRQEDMQLLHEIGLLTGMVDYNKSCHQLQKYLSGFLDLAKKPAIYGKSVVIGEQQESEYRGMAVAFRRIVENHGFTIAQLEESNRAKLTKRYKDGYSNEAAQARADKVE